ncbi:MAG: hypothetical protein A3F54_03595 [Candidatus Kerfeldbacteria bacterium RIFCSPHIGHO2_12_FULL_48_17]|uniref:Thiaminase-2/PQQC domain-containing protein n=1 Tax=Candidatus Kerfeldbacteria bacterium RIFCSPHIGHO2_12_FULL_48_17 TaxID=1798542 RepID=A0A1G2AYF7_9BACT|nr:MAG: hypothetical protein A3F54_03595 [Candidatus Kerfeldbacteria bacterium RIFCSPHIGHO2_12_FULL_48_17]
MLSHTYYADRWARGQLTLEGMQLYCLQNRGEQLFQEALCVLKGRSIMRPAINGVIEQNLLDEIGHMELWLTFTAGVGLKAKDIAYAPMLPATKGLNEIFQYFTYRAKNLWESVGALFAFEAQMPAISEAKLEALDCHYASFFQNFTVASEYYEVHREADKKHAAWWLQLFEEHCLALDDRKAALRGAYNMATALVDLLEGIHRADKTHRTMDIAFLAQRFSAATYQQPIAINA